MAVYTLIKEIPVLKLFPVDLNGTEKNPLKGVGKLLGFWSF